MSGTAPRSRWRIVVVALMVLLGALTLVPLVIGAVQTLRPETASTETALSLDNWSRLFETLPIARGLLNSAILAGGATLLVLVIAPLAGFGFAKLPFPGSQVLLYCVLGTIMAPVVAYVIPEYINFSRANLINSYVATIGLYAATAVGFNVFLFTAYFRSLPDSLIEASLMDGASYLQTYIRIILPIAVPALVTAGTLTFVTIWNDFLIGLLFMSEGGKETINVVLATAAGGRAVPTNMLLAGSLVSVLPAVLVYLIFQRHLINGFSMMAEK